MKKTLSAARLSELVEVAVNVGNPYIKGATEFFVDRSPRYLRFGEVYTREEIDNAYRETAARDIRAGYEERMVGYYDKWYRYRHSDGGRAYDIGQREAANTDGCSAEFQIIEFNTYD